MYNLALNNESASREILLQNFINSFSDPIYFKDLNSRFILVNEAASRVYQLKNPSEAIGKTDRDIFSACHAEAARADEAEIVRTGKAKLGQEEKETWPNGSVSWVVTSKYPLRNEIGTIVGTFGISRNITDRKITESKLAEQAELIERSHEAIFVLDADHRILFWNRGAESVYGWHEGEVLGRDATELFKTNPLHFLEAVEGVSQEKTWDGILQHISKSHKSITVQSRWSVLENEMNGRRSFVIVDCDITDQANLQLLLERSQRLESIGSIAGGITHDLNNLLSPILMAANLLQSYSLPPQGKRLIRDIEVNVQKGSALINQILCFARGEGDVST